MPLLMLIRISERSNKTKEDKLRSILAQLEFQYHVLKYKKRRVPFRTHLYVPEVHPLSGQEYHEQEDDARVHVKGIMCMYINILDFILFHFL